MKKKVINILIIIIGIILIVGAIYLIANKNSQDTNNDNKTNNNNNKTEEKINKISNIEISMFEASTSTPNRVDMSFKLENISNETINDKYLNINLYDSINLYLWI